MIMGGNRKNTPTLILLSERPIQKKLISADTDNRPSLPILSADISADNWFQNMPNLAELLSKIGLKVLVII